MAYWLGVDLGTTFTAAATWRDGRAEVASLGGRSPMVPSVICIREDGTALVGEAAVRRALTDPDGVVREFKRRVGDPTPIVLRRVPYPPDALMALLLRWVVDQVIDREGGEPAGIAVSHPANWGGFKRELLAQTIRRADLDGVVTVTEPEAAAIHYAAQERVEDGAVVLVYDLGGGTFDAAVLRKVGAGWEIVGTPEGIETLGGIDFDEAVFQHVVSTLGEDVADVDPGDLPGLAALARLRQECVEAKETLSSDTDVAIPVLLPGRQTTVRLTRRELEEMIRPPLEASIGAVNRALRSADVARDDLDVALLVGGSSRIPLVAQLVGSELGKPVAIDAHPKYSVALGAAILAADPSADRSRVTRVAEPPPAAVPLVAPPPEPPPVVPVAAPTSSEPAPTSSEPAPTSSEPAPTSSEPAPTSPAPAPTKVVPVVGSPPEPQPRVFVPAPEPPPTVARTVVVPAPEPPPTLVVPVAEPPLVIAPRAERQRPTGRGRRRPTVIVAAVLAVAVVAAAVAVLLTRDPGAEGEGAETTDTTAVTTTTAPQSTTAPSTTAPPESGPVVPQISEQPLWPFRSGEEVNAWRDEHDQNGVDPWHLDAEQTALAFTQDYLGFTDITEISDTDIGATEAYVTVAWIADDNLSPAAKIHLVRFGSDEGAPWEVVGTADDALTLDTPRYGSEVGSTVTVGGTISGVDESIRVDVRQPSSSERLGTACCVSAGGQSQPWETTVEISGATDPALTIVASTGGHIQDVEMFAITGVRPG